ncbi:MAG TPA: M1 family metallopeptidase [Chitinophagaceae bacterium]|nr:M1 family metallopeptidase [Chitinophagaceae bacterium]
MKKLFPYILLASIVLISQTSCAQSLKKKEVFTRQDTLRGTLTKERAWWNVLKYNINVTPDYTTKSIKGKNEITFFDSGGYTMQIDLQQPMELDSVFFEKENVAFKREGNVFFIFLRDSAKKFRIKTGPKKLNLYFHGTPKAAVNAPWDGGWIWKKDSLGNPWMSVACQGLGASVWYPCKDHQNDEPDSGAIMTINIPDTLIAIANGKLTNKVSKNGIASYTWEVKNPINSYNLVPYIGKYVNYTETFKGEKGILNCSYWVLDYNLLKAKAQFKQVPMMLKAFEHWFGPYPFYEDDFKLVEAPHLGMEHQSAVAYGNKYSNGYLGRDLSGTGQGLKWDFIIVHESGHEWFANNITTKDIADMWVHEGFTNYSETLFTQYYYGLEAGNEYLRGIRKNIRNDKPIIGQYGVNKEGSGDMYYKGANMLHTIRQIINDDDKFRSILRGLNKTFYHQTVTTKQVEDYIIKESGKDLSKVFDQYLRTIKVPTLEYRIEKQNILYRWTNVVDGFNMPVKVTMDKTIWLEPKPTQWTTLSVGNNNDGSTFIADPNFYIQVKKVD